MLLWTNHRAHEHLEGTEAFYRKAFHSTWSNESIPNIFSYFFLTPSESADKRITKVFGIKQKIKRLEA